MNKWYMFMSFTMQNYKKYFNVASDIFIFLIIVHSILKKQPPAVGLMVVQIHITCCLKDFGLRDVWRLKKVPK